MDFATFSNHPSESKVPYKVEMSKFVVVKDVNENMIIVDEATGDVRFWEAFVNHGVIIDA